jgi:hypothetical protein
MDMESLDRHIAVLDKQHTLLENSLEQLMRQPSWDEYQAEDIKKRKLKVKDELSRLYRQRYELMNSVDFDDR